ncbi:aspartyl protease family protein [Andreprevotia lacus DSM 23236]|jgi:aspartyl protease family protein|uniref:Aspartyl protease family protein n=1 Tax=Andreprevotia lacus DSM 23236 TaxID=1121001 RepID=A0A1W1XXI6_9NEIS|nr:TIGR02281 family clan AA aspartic protease [Andreprevotia lacus]SMC28567.1 aspartyl protease family protein [Andreprevotia lacus DSM 23236]
MKRLCALLAAALLAGPVLADEVTLIAVLGGKAMFKINGRKQVLAIGQESGGVKLVKLESESAAVQIGTLTRTLRLGEGYVSDEGAPRGDGSGSFTLNADPAGNFFTDIKINSVIERGLIDTGATNLSMPEQIAQRMHIEYKNGRQTAVKTANGLAKVWIVNVPRVDISGIPLYTVEVAVIESSGLDTILIGGTVLNRFQLTRGSGVLTLSKK